MCVWFQVLSKNRWTVLYCTLLAKAESEADRDRIEEEMSADPEKNAILKVSHQPSLPHISLLLPHPSPPPPSLPSLSLSFTHTHTHTHTHTTGPLGGGFRGHGAGGESKKGCSAQVSDGV